MFAKLVKNELIKIFKKRKTLVITIAFILLVALGAYSSYKIQKNQRFYNSIEYRIQNANDELKYLKDMVKDKGTKEEDRIKFKEDIKRAEEKIKRLKEEKKSGKRDWRKDLEHENKDIKENLKTIKDKASEGQMKNQLKENEYLLKHNIKPNSVDWDFNATVFFINLLQMLGQLFLIVGVIIFAADIVSGEYTPPTMKFLLTEPVSRGKILFSKFVAAIISAVGIIGMIEILAFIIIGIIFGFGDMNYPVTIGSKYAYDLSVPAEMGRKALKIIGGSHIIPMSSYLVKVFLYQLLFIIAAVALAFLISTISKSSMVSMASSITISIVFMVLQQINAIKSLMKYTFVTYGDPNMVLQGGAVQFYNNPKVTVGFTIGVMIIWIVVCYLISHIVFKKKDLLI